MTNPVPIPRAQAEKPFFWARHPHTRRRIALVSADGNTDILLATGDDSTAWAEISDEHAELLASAPALQAQNARLRDALFEAERRLDMLAQYQTFGAPLNIVVDAMKEVAETARKSARQALSTTQEFNAPQEDAKP